MRNLRARNVETGGKAGVRTQIDSAGVMLSALEMSAIPITTPLARKTSMNLAEGE